MITRLKLGLVALACALAGVACATNTNTAIGNANRTVTNNVSTNAANTNAASNDALASARTTYNNTCVKCHKENGEGGTVDADGDKLRVPNFKSGHALKHSDAEYVKTINEGGEGMPKFKGRLSDEQINGLVHFIRTEFQANANAGGAANANK